MARKTDDYEVGYGKPPRHSQFPPGVSGNKGRRRKTENSAEIVARVRDELVLVNGRHVTKFELAIQQTVNQTIRSGKPRDLKLLFELLDKHGGMPEIDRRAETEAGADAALQKIFSVFERTYDIDPADRKQLEHHGREEVALIMSCPHCGPELKARWGEKDRKVLSARYGKTGLHKQVEAAHSAKKED
ncbi:hypothetical protein FIM10_09635 [Sphingomonadales bacterium 56]|uniref:DUF5681 domain-containing protein n=1 Tax=unclassified Sphingobium TaxID=2611147 RepID=UPI00191A5305|nr:MULTISPECIES: DUF5681 domain-containing protein [unclassified Sphingobium]MBY2928935.1 hypothetical protein [Sphingomonadales bacterium 56]MBY2959213.1 hypothetical protein [Sphingomonadales bacterium 58]CAD7338275.1 hypothetical protein SPHS6_01948 [Sphingobium sp. S6]CAD7338694.1 hypothetical protein SPHS8_02164 [Sphingobium sp. S8]